MQNEEYYIDFFDYEYTVENLFKNGNYHLVMDNLTGTDRAISNLLFKENETIKTVATAYGFEEDFVKERIQYIARLYDEIYNNTFSRKGR